MSVFLCLIRELKTSRGFSNNRKYVDLKADQKFTFHTHYTLGDETNVTIRYWDLTKYVKAGDKIIADYGRIEFDVIYVSSRSIDTIVRNSGRLGENKIITIHGLTEEIQIPFLSFDDTVDIDFAVRQRVDFISASCVTSAENIEEIRSLPGVTESNVKILAKIENNKGIYNIMDIMEASDGIIITRSDVTVETPLETVALLQKIIARDCCYQGKPVYMKNQILHSMTENPRPTRAECTDIANAVLEGVDGIILTNATAVGLYPINCLKVALSQCQEVEKHIHYKKIYLDMRKRHIAQGKEQIISESVVSSAVKTAWDLDATVIIVLSRTGATAGITSKYHPHTPILCFTLDSHSRFASLYRGTIPVPIKEDDPDFNNCPALIERGIRISKELGILKPGEYVVAIMGTGVVSSSTYTFEVVKAK